MNIIFFGTPDFVIPVIQSLLDTENCKLCAVVTNPDKPQGRQGILTPSPIKKWSVDHKVDVLTPENFDEDFKSSIINHKSSLAVLAAYGKILPQDIIDLFPKGILVIHPSLLPKYRGASPIQAAIASGDKETGVTILKMDAKMDHGPIVYQFKEKILDTDTNEILRTRLFGKTAEVLPEVLISYSEDKISPVEQDHKKATFTKLITKEDGKIDWNWEPKRIERFIRAMSPWPEAWTEVILERSNKMTKRIKILKSHLEKNELVLDEVQLEGKNPVTFDQFKKGYPEAKFIPS